MLKLLLPIALSAGLLSTLPPTAEAKPLIELMAGKASDRHVLFSFENADNPRKSMLRISTHRVGNPGAKLSVLIDKSSRPLLSRILTSKDCKFTDDGAQCTIIVAGHTKTYERFLAAFQRGRLAHVEVRNAAVMQMQTDVPLTGFAKNLKG
ncbi:hypothetical protein [Rhizobium mayense]|uniref:Uncharacterized protein n=1 Tax=Rhizobium mayense TaxID=1312184 RepID=A0ABT7K7C4_9HYPH|nr:hypothetical protein [Rhizobium mayense]MDL2403925.1 hypothetical protein [Rhizobium mayense]